MAIWVREAVAPDVERVADPAAETEMETET
jgi:hypothetical protein